MLKCLVFAAALLGAVSARSADDPLSACLNSHQAPAQTITLCSAANEAKDLNDERRAAVLTQRGLARMANGELEHAREDFDSAIRLKGDSSWAYNSRAVTWMQQGDVDHGIADYEQAVKLAPGYAFAWANLGNARLVKGDIDQALSDLNEAMRLAPQRVEIVLTSRGKAWLAKGNYDRALEDFAAALQANPRHANALSGRAYARFCQGDFEAAVADFRSERQIRQDAESAIDLLIALRRAGHDDKAEMAEVAKAANPSQGLPPGVALFSGMIGPEQVIQAGTDRDARVRRLRSCAASFEVGEWYLLQPDPARARQYLQQARAGCDPSQREYAAAGAELARLK